MIKNKWPLNIYSFLNGDGILLGYINTVASFSDSFQNEAFNNNTGSTLNNSTVESFIYLTKIIKSTKITCYLINLLNKILDQQSMFKLDYFLLKILKFFCNYEIYFIHI